MNHKKLLKPTQLNYICTEMAYFMVLFSLDTYLCTQKIFCNLFVPNETSFMIFVNHAKNKNVH